MATLCWENRTETAPELEPRAHDSSPSGMCMWQHFSGLSVLGCDRSRMTPGEAIRDQGLAFLTSKRGSKRY